MPYPPIAPYFLGTATITIGLLGLTLPKFTSHIFGIPFTATTSPSPTRNPADALSPQELTSEHPAAAYLAAKSVRDIAMGICYFTFAFRKHWEAVRIMAAAYCFVGLADAMIVRFWRGGVRGKEWGHLLGTVVLAGLVWSGVGF